MTSLAQALARRGALALALTLAVAGLLTAGVLHWVQVRTLDEALLATAAGHAHDPAQSRWTVEHVTPELRAFHPGESGPALPPEAVALALARERPVWLTLGDQRVVLLVAERPHPRAGGEEHQVVGAVGPRPTLGRTIGRFAAIHAGVSGVALAVAAGLLRRSTHRAFAPVRLAQAEAEAAHRLAPGQRLTEGGPEEVRAFLAAMNALLDRLELSHSAQIRFNAEAAHELRTPLAAMLGELDVALRRPREAAEYRKVLESARAEVLRLRRLVDGLMVLAHLDAGEGQIGRALLNLAEELRHSVERVRPELLDAGSAVELEVHNTPWVLAQPELLAAALDNLLRNAARHAPGGPVCARVRSDGDDALVEVDDHGPGVPAAQREALFARFARGPGARRHNREGLGLGLPITREIAREHGGDCTLDEAAGGGTRATLRLPRALPP